MQSGVAPAEVCAINVDVPLPISVCVAKNQADHKDGAMGVIDTACGMSVCGSSWFDDYLLRFDTCRLRDAVEREPISETFRFGDGRAVVSSERLTIPVALRNMAIKIQVCVVPGDLCLLIGRDFMDQYRQTICYRKQELKIGDTKAPLIASRNGHPAVNLNPEGYTALVAATGTRDIGEVPRARRPCSVKPGSNRDHHAGASFPSSRS